jgi:hypothetical protein
MEADFVVDCGKCAVFFASRGAIVGLEVTSEWVDWTSFLSGSDTARKPPPTNVKFQRDKYSDKFEAVRPHAAFTIGSID